MGKNIVRLCALTLALLLLSTLSAAAKSLDEERAEIREKNEAVLEKLYEEIMKKPSMAALDKANMALEDMIRKVNQILQAAISDMPEGCTHDCSTCGGCHTNE